MCTGDEYRGALHDRHFSAAFEEWRTAIECLIGDFLIHARTGMLRTLNRHVERVFDPSRKEKVLGTAEA